MSETANRPPRPDPVRPRGPPPARGHSLGGAPERPGLDPPNLQNAESVCAALRAGAEANLAAACRKGSIDVIAAPGRLIATGDLHDNPVHLAKLTALAGLGGSDGATERRSDEWKGAEPPTHLLLHEIIHSDRLLNGMDFSFRALVKVAALKASFPERVHAILANHELAQVVGAGIVKDGVKVVEAFNMGVEYVFGDDTPAVTEAIGVFIKSMPLALRCHCGPMGESHHDILCAHSLPAPALMSRFDATVLSRDLTEADYEPRQGAAHLKVWGRGYDAEQIEDLVERWGVNMFILGHEKAENGVKFNLPLAYDAGADRKSWASMQALFADVWK